MESTNEDVDYIRLSKLTDGFSGSDLRECCRTASVYRMKELMALKVRETEDECSNNKPVSELRQIGNEDLLKAVAKLKESKVHCGTSLFIPPVDLD